MGAAWAALLLAAAGPAAAAAGGSAPFAACEEALARAPAQYDSYLCLYRAGSGAQALDAAAARLDRLRAEGRGGGWPALVRAHVALAQRDPWARTEELYSEAARRLAADGEAVGEVIARSNLRRIRIELGDRAGADAQVAQALQAAEKSRHPEATTRALLLEASHLTDLGQDLGRAHRALLRAEAAAFPDGPAGLQQSVLRRSSYLSYQLGRYDEAVEKLERLLALNQRLGDVSETGALRYNLANARRAEREERPGPGAWEEVVALAETTLRSAEEQRDGLNAVRAHALLADLFAETAPDRAARHDRLCLEGARQLEEHMPRMECLWSAAKHVARRRPEEARRALDGAARIALAEKNPLYDAYLWQARLRTALDLHAGEEGTREALRALEAVERLRAAQPDAQARIGVFSNWTKDYYWLAGRLLTASPPDVVRAFAVAEKMRARVLLETLQSSGVGVIAPAASQATLAEVRSRLAPGELMVAFLAGLDEDLYGGFGGGAWALAVSRDQVVASRIADRRRLSATVPVFGGLLRRRDGSEARAAAALYQDLLGGLDGLMAGARRLIIVSDGIVHDVPFAALRSAADAPPLGARYEIALVPSATLWARWRARPAPRLPAAALVMADPQVETTATVAAERSAFLASWRDVGPLPYARREGERVRRTIGGGSRLLAGKDATESALKAFDLRPVGLLHFATHAVADAAYPDRSAVVLRPGSEAEDGLLQPREASVLALHARAVVLSGCWTAAGPVASGEGVLSLARSFFEAGAQTVVASRWRLRDDEAERLFGTFYDAVGRGETMGAALRAARSQAIADGMPAATWAAIDLLGDPDLAITPAERTGRSWLSLLAAAIVCGRLLGGSGVSAQRAESVTRYFASCWIVKRSRPPVTS